MIQSKGSISKSGKNNPCYGRTSSKHPMFGKKQSKESNEKKRRSMKGKNVGINNGMYKEKVKWICPECGTIKYLKPGEAKKRKFCSLKCYHSTECSDETRKRLSKSICKEKVPFTCPVCDITKYYKPFELKNKKSCSRSCAITGKNNPNYKSDDVGYQGKHDRIIKIKGKAAEHKCIDCNKQARDWSNVDHLYSLNPDDYQPRCTSCHRKYDNLKLKNNLIK